MAPFVWITESNNSNQEFRTKTFGNISKSRLVYSKVQRTKTWKVGFLNIELLDESREIDKKLIHVENVRIVHDLFDINILSKSLDQIRIGNWIKIGNIDTSLEWISDEPRYDFKLRDYSKEAPERLQNIFELWA